MSLDRARAKLAAVPDPEIPAVSLVELGIVRDLRETPEGLEVVLTPTYSGCPATELIQDNVREALAHFAKVAKAGDSVKFRFDMTRDGCNGVEGWYVDNVKVEVCTTGTTPTTPPTRQTGSSAHTDTPSISWKSLR